MYEILVQTFIRHYVRILMNFTSTRLNPLAPFFLLLLLRVQEFSLWIFDRICESFESLMHEQVKRGDDAIKIKIIRIHSIMLSKFCGKSFNSVWHWLSKKCGKAHNRIRYLTRAVTSPNALSNCLLYNNDDTALTLRCQKIHKDFHVRSHTTTTAAIQCFHANKFLLRSKIILVDRLLELLTSTAKHKLSYKQKPERA